MQVVGRGRWRALVAVVSAGGLLLASCDWIERASVSSTGVAAGASSSEPDLSGTGRYVVFVSASTTLGNNPGGHDQIWRRDLLTNTTELVSGTDGCAGAGCVGGDGYSGFPTVSDDGRYVVFSSTASDLVAGTSTVDEQVYRADLQSGTHQLVSVTTSGAAGNDRSTLFRDVMSGYSPVPPSQAMSDDGDHVVFRSEATDLGAGGGGGLETFVHTVSTGATTLLTSDPDITSYEISDDGGQVVVTRVREGTDPPGEQISSSVRLYTTDGSTSTLVYEADWDVDTLGEVVFHAAVDGDGSHVIVTVGGCRCPAFPPPVAFRHFDTTSGSAVEADFGFFLAHDGGVALDLDPSATHALIRRNDTDETRRCRTDAIQACLDGPGNFAATNGIGQPVPHTYPVVSDDQRVVAWVTDTPIPHIGDTDAVADVYVAAALLTIVDVQLDGPLLPGSTAMMTVTGTGFAPGDTSVSVGSQPGDITVSNIQVSNDGMLTAQIAVEPGAGSGDYDLDIVVTNPAVSASAISLGRCLGCVTVDPAG